MLGCMAFAGPACIITAYFNTSAHLTIIPLVKRQIFIHLFLVVDLLFSPFWSFILRYFYLLWQSILHSMKIKTNYRYRTVIYLQLTSTFTVRFGAVPIPLYAVQRYVPLLFLLFSRTNWFPVSSTPLSLPLAYTLVQMIFGVGSPSAIHSKVILGSSSTKTTSLLTLLSSGGSVKELKTNKQLHTLFAIYFNMTLDSPSATITSLLIELSSGGSVQKRSNVKLSLNQNFQNSTNLPHNLETKIIVENFTNKLY